MAPLLTLVYAPVTRAQPPSSRRGLRRLLGLLGRRRRSKVIEALVPRHVRLLNNDRGLQEYELGILARFPDCAELLVSEKARMGACGPAYASTSFWKFEETRAMWNAASPSQRSNSDTCLGHVVRPQQDGAEIYPVRKSRADTICHCRRTLERAHLFGVDGRILREATEGEDFDSHGG